MASPLERAEVLQDTSATQTNGDTIPHNHHHNPANDPIATEADHHPFSLKHRLKIKVKAALHIDNHSSEQLVEEDEDAAKILAPLPVAVVGDERLDDKEAPSHTDKFKSFVKNPVDTVTSAIKSGGGIAVAENMITKEISHAHDVQLVQAYEEKIKAEENGLDVENAEQKVERLMESRQDMYMRWALDRHVRKMRRLDCVELVQPEKLHIVKITDAHGVRHEWMVREQDVRITHSTMDETDCLHTAIAANCTQVRPSLHRRLL